MIRSFPRSAISIFPLVCLLSLTGLAFAVSPRPALAQTEGDLEAPIQNKVSWGTASELNNFGFDVYRGLSEEGPFERITAKPMAGAGTSDETHRYQFVDDTIEPGVVYHYYVEEISLTGDRKRISPIFAAPAKGVKLPPTNDKAEPVPAAPVKDESVKTPPLKAEPHKEPSPAEDETNPDVPQPTTLTDGSTSTSSSTTSPSSSSTTTTTTNNNNNNEPSLLPVQDEGEEAAKLPSERFKIRIAERAVYQIRRSNLFQAGLSATTIASAGLALFSHGQPVPIHVMDGGDGFFGSNDWFEFVGNPPGRETSDGVRRDASLSENIYILETSVSGGARMETGEDDGSVALSLPLARRRGHLHLEQDELLPRFSGAQAEDEGTQWFWSKLTHIDEEPFSIAADLSKLDKNAGQTVTLELAVRGWSSQSGKARELAPDHRIEIRIGDILIAESEWDGTAMHTIEIKGLAASDFEAGEIELELKIPERIPEGTTDPVIDVVMVDWVTLDFPRLARLDAAQSAVRVEADSDARVVFGSLADAVIAYGDDGTRIVRKRLPPRTPEGELVPPLKRAVRHFHVAKGSHEWLLVQSGTLSQPVAITRDVPSTLTDSGNQADYIVIAHASLMDAVEPLVAYHREQGLAVELVDVEDVFDEFSHGFPLASGLKDFLEHAWRNWSPPRPRFVLLVGDASWDTKHADVDVSRYDDLYYQPGRTKFGRIPMSPYTSGKRANDRNLIPTSNYESGSGHAASDNWFVSFDGDDFLPEMAIGRFPVAAPEEVSAIVRKTLRYARSAPQGDWRKRMLWITNEQKYIQDIAGRIAQSSAEIGYEPSTILPSPDEKDNAEHQGVIRKAFDDGPLLVHFHGHGGRFIWRTGPPDLAKNHDLFTLDDLEALAPNERLPLVLSMSCYSAPFDHPSADSIGEKLLRMDGKGAVAVLAASWRNSPTEQFSTELIQELTKPGPIGEAILRAKRNTSQRNLVEQYNLLGDPALELALPGLPPIVVPPRPPRPQRPEMKERMEAAKKHREEAASKLAAETPEPAAAP
ncbi:MAG: hypothetical protein ACI8TX_001923 [Hyphomicrobiaceae bacterium]|jgi:hypothetical protein